MAEGLGAVKEADFGEMSQQGFLDNLYKFMEDRGTPIERIPHLGFKQVNLATLYKAVKKLGGYEAVTTSRLWKNIYDELGGNPGSTSAATCTRKHYERLVLPYERHLKGEDDKPLPAGKPRKQYKVVKGKDGKGSGAELKDASSKWKPAKGGVEQRSRSNETWPLADADSERGLHQGVPRVPTEDLAPASRDAKCPRTDGVTWAESCGSGSPGPIGARGSEKPCGCPGQARGCTDGAQRPPEELGGTGEDSPRPVPGTVHFRREQGVMSPLAKKKLLAQSSTARPSVIQPPRPGRAETHAYPAREEKGGCAQPQPPRYLTGVQGIVKPLLHYPCCRGFRELATPAEKVTRRYGRTLLPCDRPTDLSLPRTGRDPLHWVPESKGGRPASRLETHPKACWVPPISVALPRKVPARRAKVDGAMGDSWPGQHEEEAPGAKKLRIVPPLHVVSEPVVKDRQAAESEGLKPPLHRLPAWLLAGPTPQERALGEGFPTGYLLPIREQPLYPPILPSLALSSFMVPSAPAEALGPPGHPFDVYKHLAAGASYDNFLRHRFYPLTTCYPTPYTPGFPIRPQL